MGFLVRCGFLVGGLMALMPGTTAQSYTWGEVVGRVTDRATGAPLPRATVLVSGTNYGTAAEADGRYRLRLPEGRYSLTVTVVGYATASDSVTVRRRAETPQDFALAPREVRLGDVTVEAEAARGEAGVYTLPPEALQDMPMPVADALRAVQVLPGVVANNETSNEYSVRGGGYNENLFFLNGFEIFKPFRTRQGEQEGLSLLNADLAESITLYAGGFPVRYGGKLSSALDVQYEEPQGRVRGSAYVSTLDAGASFRTGLLGDRLGVAVAGRTARASRFFATQELKGTYEPDFRDAQLFAVYRLADGHTLSGLGMLARHRFRLDPNARVSNFGAYPNIKSARFRFEGEQVDGYDIAFGGVRLENRLSPRLRLAHDLAFFDIEETDSLDVRGFVVLAEILDPRKPDSLRTIGSGTQVDRTNNRVGVGMWTASGRYRLALGRHAAEAGWSVRRLRFRDDLFELSQLEGRETLPGGGTRNVTVTTDSLNDRARFAETQAALYAQDAFDVLPEAGRLVATLGVRADYFSFNDEWTVSPRLSARFRWDPNTSVTGAVGLYHQAPSYRELRGAIPDTSSSLGALNRALQSQRSLEVLVGVERFLPARRLYLRAEAYAKRLTDLISYDLSNTRVTYAGVNDSDGYAVGLDLQVRGEIVPGLESWVNYSFLLARERFDAALADANRTGWIARPTDQRHTFSVFFQDYVPGDDSWRLHTRALFGTGLPYTPPIPGDTLGGSFVAQAPGPRNTGRYPLYMRVDMGATKTLLLTQRSITGAPVALKLTAEVLNLFNMRNTITYAWIADQNGLWNRVPTRLTPRTVNVRLRVNF